MPTYEYECRECRHHFEISQNMSDAPLSECPECGGRVERLIGGGVGIIVKGRSGVSGRAAECGGGSCGLDSGEGPCCGGVVPCDSPPCMS